MENNLVIGNTSQLSYYFPENYIRIPSRDIDLDYLKNNHWESVYLTFAEQCVNKDDEDCINPNYIYSMEIIKNLINKSKRIIVYTTCELWNRYEGKVYINSEPDYDEYKNGRYVESKLLLRNEIFRMREIDKKWYNVKIIHPFYFNSVHRKKELLFGKIFDSIINEIKIEIGNTDFYRDMVHTKYVVERSILAEKDDIVGAGQSFNVNKFIKDLYKAFDMDYSYYVKEIFDIRNKSPKNYYSQQNNIYTYEMLLNDTINDIKKIKK